MGLGRWEVRVGGKSCASSSPPLPRLETKKLNTKLVVAGWRHSLGGGVSPALPWPRRACSPCRLAREGSGQSRSLSTLAAWKAPHVQAPRSRLRRFPAMNWASEPEPPAELLAEREACGVGDGCLPKSAKLDRV